MGLLAENGVIVALDGNGVTLRQKEGAVRHTTDRPSRINLGGRIAAAREGLSRENLTVETLEERMRAVLGIQDSLFREPWRIFRREDLDQWRNHPVERVPFLGVDWPLGYVRIPNMGPEWSLGHHFATRKQRRYFDRFELDEAMVNEIRELASMGYFPTIFTGIPQVGQWGLREALDPVWECLNPQMSLVLTPNHGTTGAEVKKTFCGLASKGFRIIAKDDDPFVNSEIAPHVERQYSPLSDYQVREVIAEYGEPFPPLNYDQLRKQVVFNAQGGEIVNYLWQR